MSVSLGELKPKGPKGPTFLFFDRKPGTGSQKRMDGRGQKRGRSGGEGGFIRALRQDLRQDLRRRVRDQKNSYGAFILKRSRYCSSEKI